MFGQTVNAYLARRSISSALLVFMDFKDAPTRLWTGVGRLRAGGHDWQGSGALIAIDGLQDGSGTAAAATTFTMTGVDPEFVSLAVNASDRVKNRRVQVLIQFFHLQPHDATIHPGANLDQPVSIWNGRMQNLRFSGDGASSRSIVLTAESRWVDRNRPPFGLYTDRDQNSRFPGDRGLEQINDLVAKQASWPTF